MGCGPGRGDLSGKVSYKGTPVKFGSVLVEGSDGVSKQGAINPDGTYLVEAIVAGSVKVAVLSPEPTEKKMRKLKEETAPKVDKTGWMLLPPMYEKFETSGISTQVKAGTKHTYDIELK